MITAISFWIIWLVAKIYNVETEAFAFGFAFMLSLGMEVMWMVALARPRNK